MSLQYEFRIFFSVKDIPLTIAASATGTFDPWYDKFNYALNTTQCADGSLCRFADNYNCCDKKQGIHEIHYNYRNSAVMPSDMFELTAFYTAAGYTFPTSIPSMSARQTSYAESGHTFSTLARNLSTVRDMRKPPTSYVTTGHTYPTSPSSMSQLPGVPGLLTPTEPPETAARTSLAAFPTPTIASSITKTTTTASRLSPGRKAGIGVGVSVGVVLGVAICSICAYPTVRRLRSRRNPDKSKIPTLSVASMELEGSPARLELEAVRQVHELDDGVSKELVFGSAQK